MTVNEVLKEWSGMTLVRKRDAVFNLVEHFLREDTEEEGLMEFLNYAANLEDDDYFGTEGANL